MLRPFQTLRGAKLAASDGEIGHVRDFYFDDQTWTVRYFVVNTGSWLFGREVLVAPHALGEVDLERGVIGVHLTREQVRESPPLDADKPVSRQHEEELHAYYGWNPYWQPFDSGLGMMPPPVAFIAPLPDDAPVSDSKGDAADSPSEHLHSDPHLRSATELLSGYTLHATDGEIGRVDDVILDDRDWRVCYLVVHTGAWFHGKSALLPAARIQRISYEEAEVFVDLSRDTIKDAPAYDPAGPITDEQERSLEKHYAR